MAVNNSKIAYSFVREVWNRIPLRNTKKEWQESIRSRQ